MATILAESIVADTICKSLPDVTDENLAKALTGDKTYPDSLLVDPSAWTAKVIKKFTDDKVIDAD